MSQIFHRIEFFFIFLNIKAILTSFVLAGMLSCSAQKSSQGTGTVQGSIGEYVGNCMPGPDAPPCVPRPIATTVFFTLPAEVFDKSRVVGQVDSRPDGSFSIKLKTGTYSLFLLDGSDIVCDVMECPDVCYCHLVKVEQGKVTEVRANLDHASW
jgi:hypothetical protein